MRYISKTIRARTVALILLITVLALAGSQAHASGPNSQAALQALNSRQDLAIHRPEDNWSHGDKVAFANFISLFHEDMTQTVVKQTAQDEIYRGATWTEENPILNPIADNSELLRIYQVLFSSFLGKRWSELKNPTQRTLEIIGANLIEVHVLNYSQESWRLAFGFDF
jgi:hypothetical protein